MRFNEFVTGGLPQPGVAVNKVKYGPNYPASKLGASRFGLDIFNNAERNPHWEMKELLDIIETRPSVATGLKQIARFIVGKKILVTSENKLTVDWMDNWLNKRPEIKAKVTDLVFLAVGLGNGYLEPLYIDDNGKRKFHNFNIVPDSSRVYRNMATETEDSENYWLFEIPIEVRAFEGIKPKYFKVNYIRGSYLFKQNVWAIPYGKYRMEHLKLGWSRDGIYGRSYLASTIDDNNILKEILKNIAIIARYRALNTKLITPADSDQELIEDDIEYIEQKLLNKRDEDHLVLNKSLKIDSLSNMNEYDTMNNEIDFLRKDISSGLTPNYITPWNEEVNRATAGEAKIPFIMELDSIRETIITFLNRTILTRLKKDGAPLAEDATFKFEGVEMESYETLINTGMMLYQNGLISFNEMRVMCKKEALPAGDKFNWEMTADQGSMYGAISPKPKVESPKVTASKLYHERHFLTDVSKKPRTKVCENCEHWKPRKEWCGLNNWASVAKDSCARFKKIEDEVPAVPDDTIKTENDKTTKTP